MKFRLNLTQILILNLGIMAAYMLVCAVSLHDSRDDLEKIIFPAILIALHIVILWELLTGYTIHYFLFGKNKTSATTALHLFLSSIVVLMVGYPAFILANIDNIRL